MSCYAEFEADNNYFDFREDSLSIASSTGYSIVDSAGNSGAHSGGSSTDSRRESDVSNTSGRRGSFVLDVYRHQGAQSSSIPSSAQRKPSDDSASSCGGGATSGAQSSPGAMPHAPSIDSNTTVHSLSDLTIGGDHPLLLLIFFSSLKKFNKTNGKTILFLIFVERRSSTMERRISSKLNFIFIWRFFQLARLFVFCRRWLIIGKIFQKKRA